MCKHLKQLLTMIVMQKTVTVTFNIVAAAC